MVYLNPSVGRDLLSNLADKGPKSEVKRLLDKGADVNKKDGNGRTPLSHAAEYRQFYMAKLLLERGATADIPDLAGRTPLSFAAKSDALEIVDLLLRSGADVNSKCNDSRTPLSYAVEGGNPRVIDLLIESGADKTIRDCEGSTALIFAYFTAEKHEEDVIARLKTELFIWDMRRPRLTELEAQVLNEDWTLKNGWDWTYDKERKPLFFQSYEKEITTRELCESRIERAGRNGPWRKWMD